MDQTGLHTPRYHAYIKWALLASLILFGLELWDNHQADLIGKTFESNPNYTFGTFDFIAHSVKIQFYHLTFWALLGLSIGKLREGLITFAITFLLPYLPFFPTAMIMHTSTLRIVLDVVPIFVFGSLVFKDNRKWQVLWIAVIASPAILMAYSFDLARTVEDLIDFYNKINHTRRRSSSHTIDFMSDYEELSIIADYIKCTLSAFHFLVALVISSWLLDRLNRNIKPIFRSLDLGVNYSKGSSTLIFFLSKWFLLLLGLSLINIYSQDWTKLSIMWLINKSHFILGLYAIPKIFIIAVFFRCFLAEYILSKGYKVSWHFFWLMTPLLGELIWLINLITNKSLSDIEQRRANFKKAIIDYPKDLEIFFYILTSIYFSLAVYQLHEFGPYPMIAGLFLSIAVLALMGAYFHWDKMIYLFLAFICTILISKQFFLKETESISSHFGKYVWSITNAIVFMVIFHLKAFKVYPIVKEEVVDDELINDSV